MSKTIRKEKIPLLIEELKKEYQVYAPVKKVSDYVFESISDRSAGEVCLEYPTTILPPKKFLFPQEEVIYQVSDQKIQVPELKEKKVLFGLFLCDAHSLLLLDEVLNYRLEDYYFSSRRENTIVVCVNHPPEMPDFHSSLGLDVHAGYDLFLSDIGEAYVAIPGSEEGERLLASPLFEENGLGGEITREEPESLFADIKILGRAVEKGRGSQVWKDLAKICFGCGVCSYVCPVCYCFELVDHVELDLESGCRKRHWDSCFLPDFSLVSGHNFREKLEDRIYHWYWHKFVQAPTIINRILCVGCGRCVHYCPAKIDYRETLETLVGELEKNEE